MAPIQNQYQIRIRVSFTSGEVKWGHLALFSCKSSFGINYVSVFPLAQTTSACKRQRKRQYLWQTETFCSGLHGPRFDIINSWLQCVCSVYLSTRLNSYCQQWQNIHHSLCLGGHIRAVSRRKSWVRKNPESLFTQLHWTWYTSFCLTVCLFTLLCILKPQTKSNNLYSRIVMA